MKATISSSCSVLILVATGYERGRCCQKLQSENTNGKDAAAKNYRVEWRFHEKNEESEYDDMKKRRCVRRRRKLKSWVAISRKKDGEN